MTETNADATKAAIELPEELNIAHSKEYHELLTGQLEASGDIELDAHAVTRVDTACIQLFAVVQRALSDAGRTLRWKAVSEAFRDSVELLGMTEHLSLPDKG